MKFKQTGESYVVKIEKDERCLATLTDFCKEQKITNAHFYGLGAAKDVCVGYYHLDKKEYSFKDKPEIVEVLNVTGNIFIKEDGLFAHAHGTFANAELETFGGHIEEMTCAVTLEIILTPLPVTVKRSFDEEIGLYLIDLP